MCTYVVLLGFIDRFHVTSSLSKIQNERATKVFVLIRYKRRYIYICLQFYSSIAGVTNGKIRDLPRRRDRGLKIRDRDLNDIGKSEPETLIMQNSESETRDSISNL